MKGMMAMVAVGFLAFGMAGSVVAAESKPGAQCKPVEAAQRVEFRHGVYLPGTHLVGQCVQGAHAQRLGTVKEMMIDAGRGQIAYLVVTPDPSLDIGKKGRLVPWTALHTDPESGVLTANIEADKFKQAPTEVTDREEAEKIHQFYGVAPYWQKQPTSEMQKGKKEELIPNPTPLWWE